VLVVCFALYRIPSNVILPELGKPLDHYCMLRPGDPVAPLRLWTEYARATTANILEHLDLFDLIKLEFSGAPLPPDARHLLEADPRLSDPAASYQPRSRLRLVR
jgi:hypothetical protein